jgi:hypothetical protein
VAASLQLSLDDRLALVGGQIANCCEQCSDLLAPFERLRRLLDSVVVLVELLVVVERPVLVDRRVPNDPEEPGTKQLRLGSILKSGIGLEEGLLDDVFSP